MSDAQRTTVFYDALASRYDDEMAAQPAVGWVRDAFREFVNTLIPSGAHVLDYGCGTGCDSGWLADRGCRVLAHDPSSGMIEQLGTRHEARIAQGQITAVDGAFDKLLAHLEQSAPIDAVISNFAVFNLIETPSVIFRGLARHMRPGTRLVISVMNPLFWKELRDRRRWTRWVRSIGRPAIYTSGDDTDLYHHWTGALRRAASPEFHLVSRASAGALIRRAWGPRDWSRPATLAERIEVATWTRFPMTRLGEFLFLCFERAG